jgi:hypothetical protein
VVDQTRQYEGPTVVTRVVPRIGKTTLSYGIGRPRMGGTDVDVAEARFVVRDVGLGTRHVAEATPVPGSGDHEVLLAALTAEGEWQQDLVALTGHTHLILARDVSMLLRLQADVHRVALGQELVEPECEKRTPMVGVAGRRALGQDPLDRCRARIRCSTSLLAKRLGRGRKRHGTLPDHPTAVITCQSEGVLDPDRQRVVAELVVRSTPARRRSIDGRAELRSAGAAIEGGAFEGFADDPMRMHSRAEQPCRQLRHRVLRVRERRRTGDRCRRADTLQTRRRACVPEPSHQQGDVGALPSAVGVEFVEDQKAQAMRAADQPLTLMRAGQQVLEHDVVGQQDVGAAIEHPVALLPRLLTRVTGKGDRAPIPGNPPGEVLLQLMLLTVGQRVHRVHDDCADPV